MAKKKKDKEKEKQSKDAAQSSDASLIDRGNVLFSWDFPEFGTAWRTKRWYRWAVVIATLLLVYALFASNYLFAVIIILSTIIYFFQSFDSPLTVRCEISEDGIAVGKRYYDYRDLSQFWIIYEPPEIKALYVEFKNPVKPRLGIPLQDQNPLRIREALREYLDEDLERENEPLSDGLSRMVNMHH